MRASLTLWLLLAACTVPSLPHPDGGRDGGVPDSGVRDAGTHDAGSCNRMTCPYGCCDGDTCLPGCRPTPDGGWCQPIYICEFASPGELCTTDDDCWGLGESDSNGGPSICQKVELQIIPGGTQPGASYPGGYCTRQCSANDQCWTGNRCGFYGGYWGEALNICMKGCDVNTDCRAGYVCVTVASSSPSGVCAPANLPDGGLAYFDAGAPPQHIGAACTHDPDCQTETLYGRCSAGTCVADCTMTVSDTWCSGGVPDGGATCTEVLSHDDGGPRVLWECRAR